MNESINLEQKRFLRHFLFNQDFQNTFDVKGQQKSLFFQVSLELKIGDVGVLSLGPIFDRVANLQLVQAIKIVRRNSDVLARTELDTSALDVKQLVLALEVVKKVILVPVRAMLETNARLRTAPDQKLFMLFRVVVDLQVPVSARYETF